MIEPGDIISYNEMCMEEGFSLQKGMNFQVNGGLSIILMSLRKGAPYADKTEENGQMLIYEGHDVPRNESQSPKTIDQPMVSVHGRLTQNGKFFQAAKPFITDIKQNWLKSTKKSKMAFGCSMEFLN